MRRRQAPDVRLGIAGANGVPSATPSAQATEPQPARALAEGETPSFEAHVKPLFRAFDRTSMKAAFDLWDYASVKARATAILAAVREGRMPCDAAWPAEKVAVLARWIDAEMPP